MKSVFKWGFGLGILGLGALATPAARPLWAAKEERDDAAVGARVEMLDVLPASKIARGLGFNLRFTNESEFARAREAGATEVRMQFDWPSVEKTRGALKLPPQMARALDLCAQNGLEPLVIAAYAPLAQPIGEISLRDDVPAGSYALPVSGNLISNLDPPFCHVLGSDGKQIVAEGRWAYYGALIDGVKRGNIPESGTISLAAKTNRALRKGTLLRVNRLLYPSVATQNAADDSLLAYARYARFLAQEIASRGLKGQVELWNEPPWIHDRWDARGGFYDAPPREINAVSPNPGMLDALLNGQAPPAGVSFVWGGSHKSGSRGLGARRGRLSAAQLRNVGADALHPYGDAPESHAWNPQALRAGEAFADLAPVGVNAQSNMKVLRQNQLAAQKRGEPAPRIVASEIGYQGSDETRKTRYNLRAFLTYLSLGMERVNFYKLADKPGKFGFINEESQQPLLAFRSFKALMKQIEAMPPSPARLDAEVPSVLNYRGTFPLAVIPISARNRWLVVTYQRTFAPAPQKWQDVASPAPAPVQIRLPAGFRALKAWNLASGEAVAFQSERGIVSYQVSDDPIALDLEMAQ